jgi:hypothetical protein
MARGIDEQPAWASSPDEIVVVGGTRRRVGPISAISLPQEDRRPARAGIWRG